MYREEIILDKMIELSQNTEVSSYPKLSYSINKNTDVYLLCLPQWSNYLPPFALARLSAILLENGYNTTCVDINIKASNIIEAQIDKLGYNPWDGTWVFKWGGEIYFKELHGFLENMLEDEIEKIVAANPKVIGFSVFWTNQTVSEWAVKRIRERLPNSLFIAGGPSSLSRLSELTPLYDIVVVGEAEKIILDILDQVENNTLDISSFPLVLTQPFKERLDLNIQPIPNFRDFDLNLYRVPNGIVTEFSRGCVAKCTFCEETHFWNFRQRGYMSLVNEIEYLNKAYGLDAVWFIDSLINGSLKELEEFAKEVIKRNLKIKFFGFARHDKRMNLDFLKLMSQAGLVAFQYGSESGSNKVLEDMKKRVTKEDMEQNFIDGAKVNIQAVTSWIIGFPTEEISDFVDTLVLIWRNRNTSLSNLVYSTRFHMNPQNIVTQNPPRFGLLYHNYDNCWIRKDFSLAKPQLAIRAKMFQLFAEEVDITTTKKIMHMPRPNFRQNGYKIKYNNRKSLKEIDWEDFNYNIINTGNIFTDSCLNQFFSIYRFLWRTRGGFMLTVYFREENDATDFGPSLQNKMNGQVTFTISDIGDWVMDVDLKYEEPTTKFTPLPRKIFFDLQHSQIRARNLAMLENPLTEEEYQNLYVEAENLNKKYSFGFHIIQTFNGSWAKVNKSLF